jgi:pantoate--beta-alanine ligase
MKTFQTSSSLRSWRKKFPARQSLGFVPTMGALHEGHLSLIRKSKKENSKTIVSIFVNPTQFGPTEDFSLYPRPKKDDLELLKKEKVDFLFYPRSAEEIYPKGSDVLVVPRNNLTDKLEGEHRPGHFEGVATVVTKLFLLVQPDVAYFGEKDFQQLEMIKALVKDLFLPVKIKGVKTVRERSGLALSSRNSYLPEKDRMAASKMYSVLKECNDIALARQKIQKLGFGIEYLEEWQKRWVVAARFRGVRLIDNIVKSQK